MSSRLFRRRPNPVLHSISCGTQCRAGRRNLIAPPTRSSGPLLERRSDRELPPLPVSPFRRWATTLPVFLLTIVVSSAAIFNYQKTSSSVVSSTLYSLRTDERARELLGNEIYFRDRFPWIWGELNQLHGRIDIGYGVKGSKGSGFMRFKSFRNGRMGVVCQLFCATSNPTNLDSSKLKNGV